LIGFAALLTSSVHKQRIEWNARDTGGPLFYRLSIGQVLA
jgi:hypothetical protein